MPDVINMMTGELVAQYGYDPAGQQQALQHANSDPNLLALGQDGQPLPGQDMPGGPGGPMPPGGPGGPPGGPGGGPGGVPGPGSMPPGFMEMVAGISQGGEQGTIAAQAGPSGGGLPSPALPPGDPLMAAMGQPPHPARDPGNLLTSQNGRLNAPGGMTPPGPPSGPMPPPPPGMMPPPPRIV